MPISFWGLREATRIFFPAVGKVLQEEGFPFLSRSRRPPLDLANALLSFAYSLLLKEAVTACYLANLDPYIGFYHSLKYGRPALALDLMEEFRPIIGDGLVLTLIRRGWIKLTDFEERLGIYSLSPNGRKTFYRAYEERLREEAKHPLLSLSLNWRRSLEAQARILAKVIEGDLPDYYPYKIR
jgi:CRISPR-associated protein Cas1